MKISSFLSQLGFSGNESAIYLASLELGMASAQDLAKKAGVQRTTAYSVLEGLVKKGLMGKTAVRGRARYAVEPPEKLASLVRELQNILETSLPELNALYNAKENKPRVVFFEGPEAAANVMDDTLRERPDEILEWNTNLYFEKVPRSHDYIDCRAELGIRARRLAGEGSVWHTKHRSFDGAELSETLIVPREAFWPDIEVNIYNDKVAFISYAEDMSLIIQSKAISEAMRQAYELAWKGAKGMEVV